jgi:hypothetical protein
MLSRRNFLRSGTLSALSIGLAVGAGQTVFGQNPEQNPTADFPMPDTARQQPFFLYGRTAFENALGTTFTSPDSRGSNVNLTLVSVKGFESKTDAEMMTTKARSTDAFGLSFNAARALPGLTTIYALNHPVLGKFDLFMTPRKSASGAIFYDATVNHLL